MSEKKLRTGRMRYCLECTFYDGWNECRATPLPDSYDWKYHSKSFEKCSVVNENNDCKLFFEANPLVMWWRKLEW